MGSLGGSEAARSKATWVYPKMMGAYYPSERWGHSACYFNGFLYIFGGCRGGVHFSDLLACDLATLTWHILKTSGPGPGPRDSHSASLVGHKMLVFGGTNGCKKVNDLHILDLLSKEWTHPQCHGSPPCPRESHTANVVNDETLVVFGGSGEGEANYLNDLHILDLKNMEWLSPVVRGSAPAPRDSHSSVAVGSRLFVFGGDSGDRYQGDVSILDMNRLTWSKLGIGGPSPGARAGHAAVSIGTKVYILGGVGEKQYYSDVWVLDVITSSWVQLDTNSRKSQGRFSHTAVVTNLGIALFGGCGEDERPLKELLILQIDSLSCRAFGNSYKEGESNMLLKKTENNSKPIIVGDNEDSTSPEGEELEFVPKHSFRFSSDTLHPKRRRTSNSKLHEKNRGAEEHSLSMSQQSSPSQSDHEQNPVKKNIGPSYPSSRIHPMYRQHISSSSCYQLNSVGKMRNMIGAEVRGQVDGAFDSGYLMTANVNGKVFRGVLFSPGPDCVSKNTILGQHPSTLANHVNIGQTQLSSSYPAHPVKIFAPPCSEQAQTRRSSPEGRAALPIGKESMANSELEGVVLTLASPGIDHGRL